MCYKDQLQAKNAAKLKQRMENDQVPMFMRIYFEDIESKAGAINYWAAIKDFIMWLMHENILEEKSIRLLKPESFNVLLPQHISMYLQYKENNGMSPTTTATRRNIIRSFLVHISFLKESTLGDMNAFFKRVRYKGIAPGNNIVAKLPTESQLRDMEMKLKLCKNEFTRNRNTTVIELLKGTGIRESELAGLDMKDLYLNEDMPYIMILGKGKYRKVESRRAYLTGSALKALQAWLLYRGTLINIQDDNAVFVNKTGRRMIESNIKDIFKIYGCGISAHMLRHYYATIMASNGNIAFAQQQLGHSALSTTIANYTNGAVGMKNILMSM